MSDYEYRAYCDICKEGFGWSETEAAALTARVMHFDHSHPDNPMHKSNCRIQRRTVE